MEGSTMASSKSTTTKTLKAKSAAQTDKPTMNDVFAEFDTMCGSIRILVAIEDCVDGEDVRRGLYSLERLADRCRANFFHALTGKTYAESDAARSGAAS